MMCTTHSQWWRHHCCIVSRLSLDGPSGQTESSDTGAKQAVRTKSVYKRTPTLMQMHTDLQVNAQLYTTHMHVRCHTHTHNAKWDKWAAKKQLIFQVYLWHLDQCHWVYIIQWVEEYVLMQYPVFWQLLHVLHVYITRDSVCFWSNLNILNTFKPSREQTGKTATLISKCSPNFGIFLRLFLFVPYVAKCLRELYDSCIKRVNNKANTLWGELNLDLLFCNFHYWVNYSLNVLSPNDARKTTLQTSNMGGEIRIPEPLRAEIKTKQPEPRVNCNTSSAEPRESLTHIWNGGQSIQEIVLLLAFPTLLVSVIQTSLSGAIPHYPVDL